MTLEKWGQLGSVAAGAGTVAAALVGASALEFAREQIDVSRDIDAQASYREFLKLGFDNPEFVEPDLAQIKTDRLHFAKYDSYVALMLSADDQILASDPKDGEWLLTVDGDLKTHSAFLKSANFKDDICAYSPALRGRLQKAIGVKADCSAVLGGN
jgi:hypothetical protein